MKTKRLFSLIVAILLAIINIQAEDYNKLYSPDMNVVAGKQFMLPINVENTSQKITALQFTITMARGLVPDIKNVELTERTENHKVQAHKVDNTRWTFMLYSSQNAIIKSNEGAVLNIPVLVADSVKEDRYKTLNLEKVVLSDSLGNNVLTEFSCGTVYVVKTPDFMVSDVKCDLSTINPEDSINVEWKVKNIGGVSSTGGWSEVISLVSQAGDKKVLATTYYDDVLAGDAEISRKKGIQLGRALGVGGMGHIKIELVPNADSGEREAKKSNNIAESDNYALTINQKLFVTMADRIYEPSTSTTLPVKVLRSGSCRYTSYLTITKQGDNRLQLPSYVTIPSSASECSFNLTVKGNDVSDEDSLFIITIAVNGYESVSKELLIIDKDPELTLTAPQKELHEGGKITLTINNNRTPKSALKIQVSSNLSSRLKYPHEVTMEAGHTSVTFDVEALQDKEMTDTLTAHFKVSSPGYLDGQCTLLIADDDIPDPVNKPVVASEDVDGWNDLSRPHRVIFSGTYNSSTGLDGYIDYAVEDSEDWFALTELLKSGDAFTGSLVALFDVTKSVHAIRLRTRDNAGNTTALKSIEYNDVSFHELSGIEEKVYTGTQQFQTNVNCDLDHDKYVLGNYLNNVNSGTASFDMEGLYPYTIGRKTYKFTIKPAQLKGDIAIAAGNYVYNGKELRPKWSFTESINDTLKVSRDYSVSYTNNIRPGDAKVIVTGIGNYSGALSATFHIDKAQLVNDLYQLTLPAADITYDGMAYGATVKTENGVGTATITYAVQGTTEYSSLKPSEIGSYDIYLEIGEGAYYYGMSQTKVGSFSIFKFDESEWVAIQSIQIQLTEQSWSAPWDLSGGMTTVSSLSGLTIRQGHVVGIELSNAGLAGALPTNLSALTALETINLSGNQLTGNIGTYAALFPNLHTLDVSQNCIEDVNPMISPNVTTLNIGQQTISRVVDLNLSELSAETIATKVPNILLYDHANQTYKTNIDLQCISSDENWYMTLSSQNGQLSISKVSEQNAYYGQSGDILNVALLDNNGTREGSTFRITLNFDEGDGNFDGQVNILDLQTTINYMFEEYTDKPYNFTASNLWEDEVINVQDAVCLVNMLLAKVESSAPTFNQLRRTKESSSDTEASVFVENNQLMIETSVPVSAFDIVVSMRGTCTILDALANLGITCTVKQSNGSAHLIGYSLNGVTLPVGRTALCNLQNGNVIYSMLADSDAQEVKTNIGGSMTGIQPNMVGKQVGNAVYRIPLGAKRAIVIDATGKKTMVKDEK